MLKPIDQDTSLMEVGRRLHAGESTIEETLEYMRQTGSAVSLTWGEDTDAWECAWITGGNRWLGVQRDMRRAVLESLVSLTNELLTGAAPEGGAE